MRQYALKQLTKVIIYKQPLSHLTIATGYSSRERAFIQSLCYQVMRYYFQLSHIANQLLKKPFKPKDRELFIVILIGLCELIHFRTDDHAAVNEAVQLCQQLKKPWANGVVNAVLRNFIRAKPDWLAQHNNQEQQFNHPAWMIEILKTDYPDDWQDLLHANDQQAPLTLRVNARYHHRDDYLAVLKQAGLEAEACQHSRDGIRLASAISVDFLPGFATGLCSVQDEAGQLCCQYLELATGMRVLDACAAPGGKTCHLLECHDIDCVALDKHATRVDKITDNLTRLGLSAQTLCADANVVDSWWDGQQFDRILLDAPCSATGIIRRQPDVKYLRTFSEVNDLVQQQQQLLENLWPLLKPDGKLLYSTCSILQKENSQQCSAFLTRHHDANPIQLKATWGSKTNYGLQSLPHISGMDGFYYMLFEKKL